MLRQINGVKDFTKITAQGQAAKGTSPGWCCGARVAMGQINFSRGPGGPEPCPATPACVAGTASPCGVDAAAAAHCNAFAVL